MRAEIPRDLGDTQKELVRMMNPLERFHASISTATTPRQATALLKRFSESQIVCNTPIAFAEFDPTVTARKMLGLNTK